MAVEEAAESRTGYSDGKWQAGAIGGLLAGVVMGVMLQMMMTPVITRAIPALYGMDGAIVGWIAHLFHSVVFGLIFVAIVSTTPLSKYTDTTVRSAGLGIVYGIVIWVIAAGIVMPLWLSGVGFPNAPPLPNFNPMSLVGHLVYGVILGAVYVPLRNR